MYFVDVVNRGSIPALEKMLAFTQARQEMLAENIANVDTPGYRTQHLDPKRFQRALRQALDDRTQGRSSGFKLPRTDQFGQDGTGRLWVRPTRTPAENILFHDGTNVRIEKQMSMLAENAMMHEMVADRLKGKYDALMTAIRGRVR